MATRFIFFAVFNALALLISGNLVDRFTGRRLFPLYLLPAFVAMVTMAITNDKWVFPLFYALLGTASGLGTNIKTAMLVENCIHKLQKNPDLEKPQIGKFVKIYDVLLRYIKLRRIFTS